MLQCCSAYLVSYLICAFILSYFFYWCYTITQTFSVQTGTCTHMCIGVFSSLFQYYGLPVSPAALWKRVFWWRQASVSVPALWKKLPLQGRQRLPRTHWTLPDHHHHHNSHIHQWWHHRHQQQYWQREGKIMSGSTISIYHKVCCW